MPAEEPQPIAAQNHHAWRWALLGGLLMLLALPPVDAWPLGWVATIPWIRLVANPLPASRKTYGWLWLGAFLAWLVVLEGIRRAHPLLVMGWIILAAYLAAYTPLFVAVARSAVHSWRVPLLVAAPVAWVALEYLRSTLLGGFAGGLLAHTQTRWTTILQLADLTGAYGLSGLMVLVATACETLVPGRGWPARDESTRFTKWIGPAVAISAVLLAWAYGLYRQGEKPLNSEKKPLRVALVQGSLDTVFDTSAEEYWARVDRTLKQYADLTTQAMAEQARRQPGRRLDLVVWPESAFAIPEALGGKPNATFANVLRNAAQSLNPENVSPEEETRFLFGSTSYEVLPDDRTRAYNSALLADANGQVVSRYYKMQLVMFGEFIPCVDLFPFLAGATPIGSGLAAGEAPVAMEAGGYRLSPSICFESFSPHLLGEQVRTLRKRGEEPDILVNCTNDGWFWGSAILDLHLRCAVLRAVEQRKPLLVAANTGFSAVIDGKGAILQQGPRRETAILLADVTPDGRKSIYSQWGDWFALACTAAAWMVALGEVLAGSRPK